MFSTPLSSNRQSACSVTENLQMTLVWLSLSKFILGLFFDYFYKIYLYGKKFWQKKATKLQYSSFLNSIVSPTPDIVMIYIIYPAGPISTKLDAKWWVMHPYHCPQFLVFSERKRERGALGTTSPQGHMEVISFTKITMCLCRTRQAYINTQLHGDTTTYAHTRGCRGRINLL